MTSFTARQYAKVLDDITSNLAASQQESAISDFAKMLVMNGDRKKLADMTRIWRDLSKEKGEISDITLTTKKMLSAKEQEKWQEKIAQIFAGEIHFTAKQDASILGGSIIKVNDMVYDASLQTKIRSLATHLKQ